ASSRRRRATRRRAWPSRATRRRRTRASSPSSTCATGWASTWAWSPRASASDAPRAVIHRSRVMTAPLFPHLVDFDASPPAAAASAQKARGTGRFVVGIVLGGCAIALSIAAVRHLVADSRPPVRQVARVALLPDTPPPPPPPKVEHKEEPKPEQRPQPQEKVPK